MSGDIASRLSAVSTSVSPFTTLEVAIATFSVSALRRFSATSNEVRLGGVEDEHNLLGREVGDPEQVAVLQARRRRLGRPRVEGRVTPHRTG